MNGQTFTCPDGHSFVTTASGGSVDVKCEAPRAVPAATPASARTQTTPANTPAETSNIDRLIQVLSQSRAPIQNKDEMISDLQRCNQLLAQENNSQDVIQGQPVSQQEEVANLRDQHNCAEGNNLVVVNGEATCVEGDFEGSFTTTL